MLSPRRPFFARLLASLSSSRAFGSSTFPRPLFFPAVPYEGTDCSCDGAGGGQTHVQTNDEYCEESRHTTSTDEFSESVLIILVPFSLYYSYKGLYKKGVGHKLALLGSGSGKFGPGFNHRRKSSYRRTHADAPSLCLSPSLRC